MFGYDTASLIHLLLYCFFIAIITDNCNIFKHFKLSQILKQEATESNNNLIKLILDYLSINQN